MEQRAYYTKEIEESAKESMRQIKSGAVRNHKLKNSAQIHTGEIEENECSMFCDFLDTRNFFLINDLRGNENA